MWNTETYRDMQENFIFNKNKKVEKGSINVFG